MTKAIASLIRRIVGRAKEKMSRSVYWLMVAMMTFPLSLGVIFWGADKKDIEIIGLGLLFFLLAEVFWVVALYNHGREQKKEEDKQKAADVEPAVVLESLRTICEELRGLRHDLINRGDGGATKCK